MSRFKDQRGVEYSSARESWRASRGIGKGDRGSGFTIRRISPRPVDIKRAERAAKRAGTSIEP